jgi:hypothetical protein
MAAAAAQAAAGNGAAATAAGTAAAAAAGAAQQSSLSAAAVGAAAAAVGEAAVSANSARLLQLIGRKCGLGVVANVVGGWMLGRGGIMGVLECLAGVLGESYVTFVVTCVTFVMWGWGDNKIVWWLYAWQGWHHGCDGVEGWSAG